MHQKNSKPFRSIRYEWGNRQIQDYVPLPAEQIGEYVTHMHGQKVKVRRFKSVSYIEPMVIPVRPNDRSIGYTQFNTSIDYKEFKHEELKSPGPKGYNVRWTEEQLQVLVAEYEEGKTLKQIGNTLGMTSDRISNQLGHMRRKGKIQ